MEYRIETDEDPHRAMQVLEDRLYEHNSNRINRHDGRLFSRVVRGQDRNIIAGIAGWTWAGVCEVTQLWVSEKLRRRGIGKRLLSEAEQAATTENCHVVIVRTYSFQAPHFYERCGYTVEHVIPNFPDGHSYYTLRKAL